MNTPVFQENLLLDSYSTTDFSNFSNPTSDVDDVYSDLFGLGKNAKAKKEQKIEKKKLKNDIIKAKAEGIRAGTFQPGSGFANVLGGVVNAAKNIIGGGSAGAEPPTAQGTDAADEQPTTPSKKNTIVWVGLVILILAALYFFVLRPKMKK